MPNTQIYVQSITPVRPEVRSSHPGLYKERLCEINNELAAIALEKNCAFPPTCGEALADDNGDLKAEYAQPDGIHIKPEATPPGWNISPPTPWANRRLKLNIRIEKPPFRYQTGRAVLSYKQERGTASKPFPIDWYLAGVAFSCISQSLSPCRYHRRVAATKLTTSNTFLILCLGYHIYPFL